MVKTVNRMIFSRFRKVDFIAIFALAILWAFITTFINLSSVQFNFIVSLFITAVFASLIALLIKQKGAVLMFYFIGATITIPFDNLMLGSYKLFILLIAGIVFEFFLFFKMVRINNVPSNLILAAAFSNASIPWAILLFASSKNILVYTVNFSLSLFLVGVIGSVFAFLVWYNIKGTKRVIKFEYSV